MKKTTILIADDHMLVRESWSFIINSHPNFSVVAECFSGEDAIETTNRLRPDIVIMDINLPGINGIEATRQISKCSPASKILGVSMHTQPGYAHSMMQKGATGYVTKSSSSEEMFEALSTILQGKKYICKEIKNILCDQMINGDQAVSTVDILSQRQLEIIKLLKKGYSSKEIAPALNISVKTVEVHRYNILKKLNLKNTAALINAINNSQLEFAT